MRHLVKGRKLSRTPSHRKATLNSLSVALIKEHRIVTTEAKAKELRPYVEPIITKAKEDTGHNRRQVFSKLQDKQAVSHLFDEVARKAKDRPGGYTRVIKIGNRSGDGAKMAVIELVDYNDIKPENTQKKTRTRRAGRSKKSSSSDAQTKTEKRSEAEKSEGSGNEKKETSANNSSEEE
ncbi:LSU ribosomal protein L17P [Fodinibius roseus]|uniref:Large ribosomal subunit protein bL17 n=1 Tax=Fodinibius roseus TaxID=1194090 RepID=A0A1M5LP01_9BACT|nr:LSU ribosomal protein L17P [Fodinibius roseus]